ncbi:MAG: TIGR04283 family arsenosugar biosynthesis glycosyltransferase [Bacteroidota bacterium]
MSVIVPTLNEADRIESTLLSLLGGADPIEVIVADGGSTDDTAPRVLATMPTATVLDAPRGRARQMNAGAAHASGEILLFLHADTRLPGGALADIRTAMSDSATAGGCFRTTFDDTRSAWMKLWQARMWMRWHRFAFGDRGLFMRRSVFDAVGGFPDQPIFEDLDMVRAIRQHGRFHFLDTAVVTSARRYQRHGALRQQLRNVALWLGWSVGISPTRLKRFYPDSRAERG